MRRVRRPPGERQKIDLKSLRDMDPTNRLNALLSNVAEIGGMPADGGGATYRRLLKKASANPTTGNASYEKGK